VNFSPGVFAFSGGKVEDEVEESVATGTITLAILRPVIASIKQHSHRPHPPHAL
jgi:hypothetical protein